MWHSKVSSIGDIEGNTRVVRRVVSWVAHYFPKSFQNLAGNAYCSKLEKEFRFQVMYNSNILLFRVSPGYFNLKLKLLPEQI